MALLFRHLIQSPDLAPRWLRNSVLGRYLFSIGLTLDAGTQWLYDGIQQRNPQAADPTTLPWLGRARRITRGFAESDESYRARLLRWRSSWRRAGGAGAMLEQIQAYFSPLAPVVRLVTGGTTAAQWWTLDSEGELTLNRIEPSNWDWDSLEPGQTPLDNQRRFWIIVYQPSGAAGNLFPESETEHDPDPTLTRGTGGLYDAAGDLLRIATAWQQEGTWCAGIIIAHDTTSFLPTGSGAGYPNGSWYRYFNPATRLPQRLTTARYFHDRRRPGLYQEGLESEIP